MTTNNTYKLIAIALMAVLMPAFAMASHGNTPQVSLIGTAVINTTSAAINYNYDSNGTNENLILTYIEYKNMNSGEIMVSSTNTESLGVQNHSVAIYNLDPNTEYNYRAVVKYSDGFIKTGWKTFTTQGGSMPYAYNTTNTSTVITTNSSDTSTSTSTSNVIDIPKVASTAASSALAAAKSTVMTGGGTHKDGVALSITDDQARTSVDDTFTYTIKYQNTNLTSLQNAELDIQLPEQYEFIKSSSDLNYNDSDNTLSYRIGRIAPNALKTVTFTARAIGDGNGEVKTTATLYYEGGSISATDRDSFHGGSKSVLGASVFGAGFFPQTLGGWALILILIIVIVVVARRYMVAAPKPVVVVQHPAQPQPAQK
jgi:uncharacterized repeat protein (TIGR01451 family)